jgi:hypothetical protein
MILFAANSTTRLGVSTNTLQLLRVSLLYLLYSIYLNGVALFIIFTLWFIVVTVHVVVVPLERKREDMLLVLIKSFLLDL